MLISLKPYSKKKKPIRKPLFAVMDIESTNWKDFLLLGSYWIDNRTFDSNYKECKSIKEYVDYIFSEEFIPNLVYAHFGGIFDFYFLLDYLAPLYEDYVIDGMIPRGSGLLCMSISKIDWTTDKDFIKSLKKNKILRVDGDKVCYKQRTIKFLDSSAVLPFSLEKICESFGVEHKKLKMNRNKIVKITPQLRKYLKYDCMGLYECMEKYAEWNLFKEVGVAYTMASQALKVLRLFLKNEIFSLSSVNDEYVRKSYFGGRTEIFKPIFIPKKEGEKIYCFDVNSLYPTVMRNNIFPNEPIGYTRKYDPDSLGFWDVEMFVPHDIYIPPLCVRDSESNKLIFPTGKVAGRFTTIEIEYAKSIGCTLLKVDKGLIFKSGGYIFKNFIDVLYKMRLEAQKKKDGVSDIICKLLMNSCYGRFGISKIKTEIVFYEEQEGYYSHYEYRIRTPKGFIELGNVDKVLDKTFSNVAIAAWVTSLARVYMHKNYYQKYSKQIYYTDTDSLMMTQKIKSGDKLGEIKLEYEGEEAVFVLPKTYIIKNKDPIFKYIDEEDSSQKTNFKVVIKGMDRKKIQHFRPEDFMAALEGELRLKTKNSVKLAKLKSAMKKNSFLALQPEMVKVVRSMYDKRRPVKCRGKIVDTKPIKVEMELGDDGADTRNQVFIEETIISRGSKTENSTFYPES